MANEKPMDEKSLIEIRRSLHQIPEPGLKEVLTQQFLLRQLAEMPQNRLEIATWETGILVRLRGTNPVQTIAWRTDIDGLPIQEETTYNFRSKHEGYMHACGHDMHMTIALGLLRYFILHPISDNLLFVFQPAEEGPGGALPMMASEQFAAWKPDVIYALHIAPEYPVGVVAVKPGLLFANTSELFIHLHGRGGHAAYPHRANDMVIAGAHLITQLQTIVSRNVDPLDSIVVTIGKLTSGTKQNIIAGHCLLEGTIRTLSKEALAIVKPRIEALVHGIETGFDCTAEIDYGSSYCQVWNDEQITPEFMEYVRSSGTATLVECKEAMTGEDFGYFLEKIPGLMFWLGVDAPYSLHSAKLEPNEGAIDVAIRVVSGYLTHKYQR